MELDIKDLQKIELNILTEIDKVCRENNLKYFLIGGTLLGAIRHGGFIPWDDDIDIGMPREDYEKFISIANEKLPKHLKLQCHKNTKRFPYAFAKVIDTRTAIVEKELNFQTGLYVDIFPFDGVPENKFIRKMHFRYVYFLRRIFTAYFMDDKIIVEKKGRVYLYLIKLMRKIVNIDKVFSRLDNTLKKYTYKESKFVCNYLGAYFERETVPKDSIGKLKDIIFEGKKFMSMEKPEDFLKNAYGDYMKLPPVEKRKSHHDFEIIKIDMRIIE